MPRTQPLLALALVAIAASTACAEDYDDTDPRFLPGTSGNSGGGVVFNTNEMDDIRFSELTPALDSDPQLAKDPGGMMPGFTLAALALDSGLALEQFEIEAGEIVGFDAHQGKYKGAAMLRSEWTIQPPPDSDDTVDEPMTMRLKEIVPWGDDVPRYRFESISGIWPVPTCPVGPNGPGVARLLAGFSLNENTGHVRNAPATTYFACNTGATGKAADLGFYDLVVDNGDANWTPFEVAIRVIRADYCYDGESFTTPGTAIVIEDRWGVMAKAPGPKQGAIEAVWGATGLICRGTGRHSPIACASSPPTCKGKSLADYPTALFLSRLPVVQEVGLDPVLPL